VTDDVSCPNKFWTTMA